MPFDKEQYNLIISCLESRVKTNSSMLNTYNRFNRNDIPKNLTEELELIKIIKNNVINEMTKLFKEDEIQSIKFYELQGKKNTEIAELYNCTSDVISKILE